MSRDRIPLACGLFALLLSGAGATGCGANGTGENLTPGKVVRPGGNTGTGFFVADGKLYDANGTEFRIRGVNRCHYDSDPEVGIGVYESAYVSMKRANANAVRISLPIWDEPRSTTTIQLAIDNGLIPVPAVWFLDSSYDDSRNVTCKSDTSYLTEAVDSWIARYDAFKPFEKHMLLNIANEWGPRNKTEDTEDNTVWRDAYIEAVQRLREKGYLCTLVIDTGGCGQDPANLIKHANEVFNSDPQRNIVFDLHIYGEWTNIPGETYPGSDWPKPYYIPDQFPPIEAAGLPVVIGEFGPGRNIGPSPATITPGEVISAADAHQFGWLAWAWDDGNDDGWFALTTNRHYSPETASVDLTIFGHDVVENSDYGLLERSQPASIFQASP